MRYLSILTLIIFALCAPFGAWAQSNQLEGYVPPPLFAPQKTPPKKDPKADVRLPSISKEVAPSEAEDIKEDIKSDEPLIKPRVFKQVEDIEPLRAPADRKTKEEPTPDAAIMPLPPVKPLSVMEAQSEPKVPEPQKPSMVTPEIYPEPIDLLRKDEIPPPPRMKEPEPKPVPPKPTSEGVVKGPKTMPSNKKQAVAAEVLYESEIGQESQIMERMQEEAMKELPPAEPPEVNPEVVKAVEEIEPSALPRFTANKQGAQELLMAFQPTQSELGAEQEIILSQIIVPEMSSKASSRLSITAYASPQEEKLSGDRRIALSRALAVRGYLVEQNISPNRIDVRALGAQTDIHPMDRVEMALTP